MTVLSNYEETFGSTTKLNHSDVAQLPQVKRLSNLKISHIIKPEILKYFDTFLSINDVDEFSKRIFNTIRDIHTVIKN